MKWIEVGRKMDLVNLNLLFFDLVGRL